MSNVIGIQQFLLNKYPNQNMKINSIWGSLITLYKDEEMGISGNLTSKTMKEIKDEGMDDWGLSFLRKANFGKYASGGREEATPWLGFRKIVGHSHGNIALNFVITRQLGDAMKLLNKMSMQEIDKIGLWSYDPTDVASSFFDDKKGTSGSNSASKPASTDVVSLFNEMTEKFSGKLFSLEIGDWFYATDLLVDSIDYRVKTAVFDQNGSPEFLEVTMNLSPVRKLSASEISAWFRNLHNKKA